MARKFALVSTGPLSGKSTLAKHMERNYGFIRADHSRTLVQSFVDNWNNPLLDYSEQITVEQVYAEKEDWRPLLQEYGWWVGFNNPDRAVYWTKRTLKEWMKYKPERDVVFDSFRGEVQAQVMRDLGFTLVQLEISEELRLERAKELGRDYEQLVRSMAADPSLERGIARPDITLDGSLDFDVQARILIKESRDLRGLQTEGVRK